MKNQKLLETQLKNEIKLYQAKKRESEQMVSEMKQTSNSSEIAIRNLEMRVEQIAQEK